MQLGILCLISKAMSVWNLSPGKVIYLVLILFCGHIPLTPFLSVCFVLFWKMML